MRMPFKRYRKSISIHALRVEGDETGNVTGVHTHWISIHALRVEGDPLTLTSTSSWRTAGEILNGRITYEIAI